MTILITLSALSDAWIPLSEYKIAAKAILPCLILTTREMETLQHCCIV